MNRFDTIIRLYKVTFGKNPDSCIEYAKNQKHLADAIRVSTLSINENGKRHNHQYRIPQMVLELWYDSLMRNLKKIQKSISFDELLSQLQVSKIKGIGTLTIYDTATRIGAYMNLYPDKVYLHAGTLEGAKKILKDASGPFILKRDLPKPFQRKDLACWEIEDILCIYKNDFDSDMSEHEFKKRCLEIKNMSIQC
jgi:hypothetical protein